MSLVERTTEIVAAFVENNSVAAADLPVLIKSIYATLANIDAPAAPEEPKVTKATPAQIRKSITDAGLVSFEDGRTYQTLKRSLALRGLTLDAYKAKWGLPKDYPTTAPAYAAKRSALAKSSGFGKNGRPKAKVVVSEPKRARPKKVTAK